MTKTISEKRDYNSVYIRSGISSYPPLVNEEEKRKEQKPLSSYNDQKHYSINEKPSSVYRDEKPSMTNKEQTTHAFYGSNYGKEQGIIS